MSNELTEKDKKIMVESMGEGMGKALKEVTEEVKKENEAKQRLIDQRYENTVERLTRIETKLDELLKK